MGGIVEIQPVQPLARVSAKTHHTVVAGALETQLDQFGIAFADFIRGPIEEGSDVALALHGRVDGIGALEGCSIGGGLHVGPSVGHLRLAQANAVFLGLVEVDIPVHVPQLD